jgi:HPt (histidine-containing phosphotransfer) domain-containing protein
MTSDPINVHIDRELEDLIPGFLNNRQKDIQALMAAVGERDFASVRMIGHRLKGTGGGYGFDRITEIGQQIESAGIEEDVDAVSRHVEELDNYMGRVQVEFV